MKKHIPNAITCCNLICGCLATSFAFGGQPTMALLFIILGAVFDFFDGMTARLLGVSSPIGKELDSLADDVTFGVAPSTMVYYELSVMDYPSLLIPLSSVIPYLAFVMAAFSALRLAKFNLDERQSMGFIGLPTPANALIWVGVVLYCRLPYDNTDLFSSTHNMLAIILAVVSIATDILMVCELPMFSLKFHSLALPENVERYVFLTGCILLLALMSWKATAWIILWYILLSLVWPLVRKDDNA